MLKDYIDAKITEAYDYMQNDSKKALKIFNEILEIEPENMDAINGKGSTLIKLNRLDEAENWFNFSLSISENSSAFINKGIIYKLKHDFDKSLHYLDKAYELNPDLKNIINILKNEISEKPDDNIFNTTDPIVNELIQKGIELKDKNHDLDAYDKFVKAIEIDSSCKTQVNRLIRDIRIKYEKEFEYNDDEINIRNKIDRLNIQALRALKENNPHKALTLMNLALEINETNLNTLNHKGGALFICNNYPEAIKCFDKCLSVNKTYYSALFNKAKVYRIMNRLPESMECFSELEKVPEYSEKVKPHLLEIRNKLKEK